MTFSIFTHAEHMLSPLPRDLGMLLSEVHRIIRPADLDNEVHHCISHFISLRLAGK